MQSQWVIWLLLLSGVAYVSGSTCNTKEASNCFEDLVHYESLSFPLYGGDEASLEDTCEHIAASFSCIRAFQETCAGSPDCGDDCQEIVGDIKGFLSNSGLEIFAGDLCAEHSPLRQTYLENVECMESIVDEYATCHNDSQKSLSYLTNIEDIDYGIKARCCYSSWYDQCFTNATRDFCGENATMFVSYAIHKLVSQIIDQLCAKTPEVCHKPPMPGDEPTDRRPQPTESDADNEIEGTNRAPPTRLASTGVLIAYSFAFVLLSFVYVL